MIIVSSADLDSVVCIQGEAARYLVSLLFRLLEDTENKAEMQTYE